MANYYLSKNIAKTAISKNQVYFSTHGITYASDWLEETEQVLKFSPALTSFGTGDYLNKQHTYMFESIKNL